MKKYFLIALLFTTVVIIDGCSDLEEEVLDEALTGGATPDQIAAGSLVPAYGNLLELFQHTLYFALQEISTDEAILPYRGGTDWGDNNIYIDMHRHTYSTAHIRIKEVWDNLARGISRSVTATTQLRLIDDPSTSIYLAEARALRAYYCLLTLDLYGLVFVKEDPAQRSTILRGSDAVDYIKNELLAVENTVSSDAGPGRITQGAVWGLLARLYLNAAVYRDPYAASFDFNATDMDKVVEYCDKIIASGQYQLSPEYFEIFADENHTNKELIWAADQRADLPGAHNRLAYFSLSGDQYPLSQFVRANGTDGPAITPDFYQTWASAYSPSDPANKDPRFFKENLIIPPDSCIAGSNYKINRGILRGQQYGLYSTANGQPFLKCADGVSYRIKKLFNNSRSKPTLPVNFTESINFTTAGSNYSTGYRVEKYEFSKQSDTGRNKGQADIVVIRYADIYLMRAEAKLRKGDAAGGLSDVNAVRSSRTARGNPPPALSSLDLATLYRERGFEFYWEMQRRTDMIRFGKYEDSWTEKTDNNKLKRLFPIPQTAIDGASNTPGYLVQNQGY